MTVIFVVLALAALWIWWGNGAVELNPVRIECSRLPQGFRGFKIAHISDLHNDELGRDNGKILALLREAKPDIIAVTGDLIDSRDTDIDTAEKFVAAAAKIAPVYYATGNHESRIADYPRLEAAMRDMGVSVLRDDFVELEKDGEKIRVIGIDDPAFKTHAKGDTDTLLMELGAEKGFSLVLAHRPELLAAYAQGGAALVLSGHAHGGQVRIPFIGGAIALDQGLFPELTQGVHESGETKMVISRGLGNSLFPFRVNNRPEVVLVELG